MTTPSKTVVIDNGSGALKVGLANHEAPVVMPCLSTKSKTDRRTYVGDQIADCKDTAGLFLRRPFDKGYMLNTDVMQELWDRAFSSHILSVIPKECSLCVTEPLMNPSKLQKNLVQLAFEYYGFQSLYIGTAPQLAHYDQVCAPNTSLFSPCGSVVVDAGYSFSHVAPVLHGHVVNYGVKRISVGGRLLTNHLKELISFRSFNMMDEVLLMNDVKERSCFCSLDYNADMALARRPAGRNGILSEYLLPDRITRGFGDFKPGSGDVERGLLTTEQSEAAVAAAAAVEAKIEVAAPPSKKRQKTVEQEESQRLCLNTERFAVPEVLFRPADIGIKQAGLAEAIVQSMSCVSKELHPILYSNVLLTGGCAKLPGFRHRLESELRSMVPSAIPVNVKMRDDPSLSAWHGGAKLASSDTYASTMVVTKSQYQEHGYEICMRKFAGLS